MWPPPIGCGPVPCKRLAAGAHRDLGYQLLEALLDDMTARNLPLEQQLAALADAIARLLDLRDNAAMRVACRGECGSWAWRAADAVGHAGLVEPFASACSPCRCSRTCSAPVELERSIRAETIQRAYAAQPAETLRLVRTLRLFDQQRYSPLVDWLESLAARDLPGRPSGEAIGQVQGRLARAADRGPEQRDLQHDDRDSGRAGKRSLARGGPA